MMMPHRARSVYHIDKLLPYGTAKESSIRKKCCLGGERNCFLRFGKMKTRGLYTALLGIVV